MKEGQSAILGGTSIQRDSQRGPGVRGGSKVRADAFRGLRSIWALRGPGLRLLFLPILVAPLIVSANVAQPGASGGVLPPTPVSALAEDEAGIPRGAEWRYFRGNREPPANWTALNFNHSSWNTGPSGFGYGDGDDATVLPDMPGKFVSLYLRRTFQLDDPSQVKSMVLSMDYDDGFVAYLNGVEVARDNVTGRPPAHNYRAVLEREASGGGTRPKAVGTFDLSGSVSLLVAGKNVLAVQGHNKHLFSSDFSLIPSLAIGGASSSAPPPEDPPPALPRAASTLVRHPYLQLPRTDGMTIVWATREENIPTVRYGLDWTAIGFDDSSWPTGPSGFGYEDGDDATVLTDMQDNYVTVFARRTFTVPDPSAVEDMVLSVDYDDGFVAYLNGREVARANVAGVRPTYNTPARGAHEASGGDMHPQPAAEFALGPYLHLLVPGTNVLAFVGHNSAISSTDFSLIPALAIYSPDPVAAVAVGDVWRYFKGQKEPQSLDHVAAGSSTFYSSSGGFYQHEVTLNGLQPGAHYSYRIYGNDVELTAGPARSFHTVPNSPHFTFAAFGDAGTGGPDQLAVRDRLAQGRPDLVVMMGDLSEEEGTYSQIQRTFFDVYTELLRHVPFVPTTGNHDYMTDSAQPFLDLFVLPRNGAPGLEERYFSFNYGNVHFVALDTELVGQTQAQWLEDDLAGNEQFWTVVYFHRPAFGEGSSHRITEAGATGVRRWFAPIFEKYGVDLVLSAHNDGVYGRSVPLTNAQAGAPYATATTLEDGGVVYVTSSGGGDGLSKAYTDDFHKAPGATYSAYQYTRVAIADCLLDLQSIDNSGAVRDTFAINRCPAR